MGEPGGLPNAPGLLDEQQDPCICLLLLALHSFSELQLLAPSAVDSTIEAQEPPQMSVSARGTGPLEQCLTARTEQSRGHAYVVLVASLSV